jgi:tape measure domain-containing protein
MTKEVFQLEVQVNTNPALTGLSALDKKLKDVKDSADKIGKGNPLGGLNTSVKTLTASFAGLGSILGGLAIGKVATEAITAMVAYERLETVLGTVTGSITNAADAMKLLKDVSQATPFSINQLGDAYIKLKSSGIEPTAEKLKLFSDIASVTTDKVGALTAITDLYARTTAGGLGLEELNRLAERGIPVYDILAKRIGVNRLEISELGKSAQGSAIIIRQLEAGLKESFSGASAKNINTLGGQFDIFQKNLENLATTAGKSGATAGLTDLTKTINELTVAMQPIAALVGRGVGDVLSGLTTVIKEFTTNTLKSIATILIFIGTLRTITTVIDLFSLHLAVVGIKMGILSSTIPLLTSNANKLTLAVVGTVSILRTFITAITGSFAALVAGNIGQVVQLFRALGAALLASPITGFVVRMLALAGVLNPIGATITAIVGTLFLFRNSVIEVGGSTASVAEILWYAFKRIGDAIVWPFEQIGKLVSKLGELIMMVPGAAAAADALGKAWEIAGKAASSAWEWTKEVTVGGIIKNIDAERSAEQSAKSRAEFRKSESEDAEKIRSATEDTAAADRKAAEDLKTGRAATLIKILDSLRQESSLLGKTKQDAEQLTKEYELQNSIKQKLLTSNPTISPADLESKSKLTGDEKASIAREISKKYQQESIALMSVMNTANNLEISLLSKSNNERDRAVKLEEIRLQLGMKSADWSKVKAGYEAEILRLQEAQITESLNKNLEGIAKETEYLKLGNDEREKRIALDKAAADAGFKDAAELSKKRPQAASLISDAVGIKNQTVIDVAGQAQIRDLKEESALLAITNDLDRERAKKKNDIYKAIDPEGRGKKINEMQRNEIEALLNTIEAQEKLLEVNKKIDDAFATLGDAASNWALGTEGAIKRVRLALLQLATLAAFKYFAGGMPTGAAGSFLTGVLGGLSGARAEGGPVDAGKSYLVGEKRPEVFVPTTNGYIVPNTAMMNTSTGATHVTMSPNLIIQGSVTGQTELENMFDQFAQAMAQETQNFVISQRGQNGILAR